MKPLQLCLAIGIGLFGWLNSHAEESQLMQKMREAQSQRAVNLPLHEEHDEGGELIHLGVALFDTNSQKAINPHLWRGAERMLLELAQEPTDQQRKTWLKERNVNLWIEGTAFGTGTFTRFDTAIPILKRVKTLKLNEEADRYRLIIYGGPDSTLLRLSFPKERELIFGTDKKEEDQKVAELIMRYEGKYEPRPLPTADDLLPTSEPRVWHTAGEALYIDSLRTDGYYTVSTTDGTVRALDSAQHPKEWITNLLLGIIDHSELTVNVMHRQYGNVVKEWYSTWEMLLAALCSEERTVPYAAVHYSTTQETATGVLVLHNKAFDYTHMLLLSIPISAIGETQPLVLNAMLYTNIPQQNVLSLFEERQRPAGSSANRPTETFNHTIKQK